MKGNRLAHQKPTKHSFFGQYLLKIISVFGVSLGISVALPILATPLNKELTIFKNILVKQHGISFLTQVPCKQGIYLIWLLYIDTHFVM